MSTDNGQQKPDGWVDFKEIKAQASVPVILKYLKLLDQLEKKDGEWIGFCPFHPHTGRADSFHVSETQKSFHCFACKKKGSVLDLVHQLINFRGEPMDLRGAAECIKRWMERDHFEQDKAVRAEKDRQDVGIMDAALVVEGRKDIPDTLPDIPAMKERVRASAAVGEYREEARLFDNTGLFLDFSEACKLVSWGKAHPRDFVAVRAVDLIEALQKLSNRT